MRNLVLATFLVTGLGTGFELLLLEHMEDLWQIIPLILILIAVLLILWLHAGAPPLIKQIFLAIMAVSAASALLGIGLHLKANIEFEQEMYPTLEGMELIWKSLKGATPSLAPGTMLAIAMLGLLYTKTSPTLKSEN